MSTIYVISYSESEVPYFYNINANPDEVAKPFFYLREEIEQAGFRFELTTDCSGLKDVAAIISLTKINQTILQNLKQHPKNRCYLVIVEPPVWLPYFYDPRLADFFGTIFTMFDDQVDNQTYFKIFMHNSREKMIDAIPDFADKKFCVMVQSNLFSPHPDELYSERYKVAHYLTKMGDFDLYGAHWEGVLPTKGRLYTNKLPVIKNYKFLICYENMHNQKGYISEKIIDAFYGGVVPIYWGAENITDYIPKECFIDRRKFSSNEELIQFMKSIDRKTYESYLAAAKNFLQSPQAELFSSRNYSNTIVSKIKYR